MLLSILGSPSLRLDAFQVTSLQFTSRNPNQKASVVRRSGGHYAQSDEGGTVGLKWKG